MRIEKEPFGAFAFLVREFAEAAAFQLDLRGLEHFLIDPERIFDHKVRRESLLDLFAPGFAKFLSQPRIAQQAFHRRRESLCVWFGDNRGSAVFHDFAEMGVLEPSGRWLLTFEDFKGTYEEFVAYEEAKAAQGPAAPTRAGGARRAPVSS